jgi:diguanylate cyclase (GGDEF)-like protein
MDISLALPATQDPSSHIEVRARIDALNDEAWPIRFTDRERSEKLAREALELADAAEYPVGIALAVRTLGVQRYYFRSDYDGGAELLHRALALLDDGCEMRGRADVLNGIGTVHRWRGEYAITARLQMEALQIHRAAGDRAGESQSLNLLGVLASQLGDYGVALEYYQESLALQEQVDDRAQIATTIMNIGVIYAQLGDQERALEYMMRVLQINEHPDPHTEGVCLCNIGNSYNVLGERERALGYLERAAAKFRALGHVAEANCLSDIGRIHEQRGDRQTAHACYLRALEMVRRAGVHQFEMEILTHLGTLECADGEADAGLSHLHEALALAEAQGTRQYVHAAHQALANAYRELGDTARALEHYQAFHEVWVEVFGARTNLRIQNARIREEVRQTERESEILREKNEALTRADEEKARLLEQLRIQAAELERQTREDALTGVSNRRHLDDLLAAEWERAHRFRRALCVAMVDVDHFKQVNDRFSHAGGDEVLRRVARILREHTRGVDVVARYGGEEFCLVLVETSAAEAAPLCERLRALVQAHDWTSLHPGLAVTVSIGIAERQSGVDAPAALLAAADAHLYAAKHAGRNRVCAG